MTTNNIEMDIATKPWLTKRELAAYLGFSERYVDEHVRQHIDEFCPSGPSGKKILFSRAEVDSYITSTKRSK